MPVPVSTPSMVVAMIMAVPTVTAVPMTTPAAPVPSASRVTQLDPSEVVLSERLCGHLLRRTGVRQRGRAPSAEIERGDRAKEPGKEMSPVHLLLLLAVGCLGSVKAVASL